MNWKTTTLSACTLVLLASCAESPTGRSQLQLYSNSELNKMGAASYKEMREEEKINEDAEVNAYVRCISDALIENLPGDYSQITSIDTSLIINSCIWIIIVSLWICTA